MSFQENKKTEKYKLPCRGLLHSMLFTRKPWMILCSWQVFWLVLNRTPSHWQNISSTVESLFWICERSIVNGQKIHHSLFTIHHTYSYGDSSGFKPDSLLIPNIRKPNAAQKYCSENEIEINLFTQWW